MRRKPQIVICCVCGRERENYRSETCRPCYSRAYREEHKEQIAVQKATWRLNHLNHVKEQNRTYYRSHMNELKGRNEKYRIEHREEFKAYSATYRARHLDECRSREVAYKTSHASEERERRARWAREHKDATNTKTARRRARKKALPATLTTKEWEAIKSAYKQRCAYCGKKPARLQQEHVIPLSKDGPTTMSNIVPACPPCNYAKHTKLPNVPVPLVLL